MEFEIHVYNSSGTKQAVVTDFLKFSYVRRVNHPGALHVTLTGNHSILENIADRWRFNVRAKPTDGSWRSELWTLFRDETWAHQTTPTFTAYCPGIMSLLGQRIVNWPAGVSNRSVFASAAAETAMKTLVSYNAGANATTGNGRKRTGTISGLTVASDSAGGNSIDWYCHGDNLLETLRELAAIGGGDFDLVPSSATAYEFEFYAGQLGTDRAASLVFSLDRGNMADPVYEVVRSKERTVACVWGQGEGGDREYVTRTGGNYSAANDSEFYVDARDVSYGETSALQVRGDTKLDEKQAKESFGFRALQASASAYIDHYDVGDLATAINPFNGSTYTVQIKAVSVTVNTDGHVDIGVEASTQ